MDQHDDVTYSGPPPEVDVEATETSDVVTETSTVATETSDVATGDESSASRLERLRENRKGRRVWLVLAIVMSLVLVGGVVYGALTLLRQAGSAAPKKLVLATEATLEDGTTVAGLIATLDKKEGGLEVQPVDPGRSVSIPGTSYDRLADALPLGGGELIAQLLYPGDETVGAITLSPAATSRLIDAAGGVDVDVPAATTVFTGEELFRFDKGRQHLNGAQAVALSLGAETVGEAADASELRMSLARALGEAAVKEPRVVTDLVGSGLADSSVNSDSLAAFFSD